VLSESGADVNMTTRDSVSPVCAAVQRGHYAAVKALMECGADMYIASDLGSTPMHEAACSGHIDLVRLMTGVGTDVNARGVGNSAPLTGAAKNGELKMMRLLVEKGADVNFRNGNGATAIYSASQEGETNAVRLLAELGADVNIPHDVGATPVYIAALKGRAECIQILSERGADVNMPTHEQAAPVHVAAQRGHFEAVKALADCGADLNKLNKNGETALGEAAYKGHIHVVKFLGEFGVDIDLVAQSRGATPLKVAVNYSQTAVTDCLLNMGACTQDCFHSASVDQRSNFDDQFAKFRANANSSSDSSIVQCCLYSLTHLLAYNAASEVSGGDSRVSMAFSKTEVAKDLRSVLGGFRLIEMQNRPYVLRRRLARIAWRVVREGSEALDGDRVSAETMARRYVEVWCLLMNSNMLKELLSLRMTCKSNHEAGRRRFPVYWHDGGYSELEANMMEEWVVYASSRFVSTAVLHAVIRIHKP